MALALPLLLLIMFGTIDLGRALFANLTLQHAVREAGRFAVTGRTMAGTSGSHPRLDSILQVVVEDSKPFPITAADITVSSVAGGAGTPGGPGDLVTISINYPLTFLTPLIGRIFGPSHQLLIKVSSTFRNEFFPPGQWN